MSSLFYPDPIVFEITLSVPIGNPLYEGEDWVWIPGIRFANNKSVSLTSGFEDGDGYLCYAVDPSLLSEGLLKRILFLENLPVLILRGTNGEIDLMICQDLLNKFSPKFILDKYDLHALDYYFMSRDPTKLLSDLLIAEGSNPLLLDVTEEQEKEFKAVDVGQMLPYCLSHIFIFSFTTNFLQEELPHFEEKPVLQDRADMIAAVGQPYFELLNRLYFLNRLLEDNNDLFGWIPASELANIPNVNETKFIHEEYLPLFWLRTKDINPPIRPPVKEYTVGNEMYLSLTYILSGDEEYDEDFGVEIDYTEEDLNSDYRTYSTNDLTEAMEVAMSLDWSFQVIYVKSEEKYYVSPGFVAYMMLDLRNKNIRFRPRDIVDLPNSKFRLAEEVNHLLHKEKGLHTNSRFWECTGNECPPIEKLSLKELLESNFSN